MERQVRKAINFDLDTKVMKEQGLYPKGYKLLKNSFKELGFKHRQGSGYVSENRLTSDEVGFIIKKIVKENFWLADCVKKIDVTDIGRQHDLTDMVKDFAEHNKEKDDELQGLNKPYKRQKEPQTKVSKEMLNLISNMPTKKQDVQLSAKNEYVSD